MSYDTCEGNPYSTPEKWGLEIVDSLEMSEPDYSFDTIVVWKDIDGNLYWAHDSGCSCPMPFENFHSMADLTKVNMDELDQVAKGCYKQSDYLDFMEKVKAAKKTKTKRKKN